VTDATPRTVLQFPERPRPKLSLVPKTDCLASLEASVLSMNPTGMSADEIIRTERERQKAKQVATAREMIKEGFKDLVIAITLPEASKWLDEFAASQRHKDFAS
jgi:hypothetical protein